LNIHDLISSIQADLEQARRREQNARAEIQAIISAAKSEHRKHLTESEDLRADKLFETVESAQADQRAIEGKLARAEAARAEDQRADELSRQSHTTRAGKRMPAYDEVHRIGGEQQAYRSPAEHGTALDRDNEPSFIRDLYSAQVLQDPAAMGRLERHGRQVMAEQPLAAKQLRAFGTGAVPGFAPPQYLAEEFALFARAGRPAASLCRSMPLPPEGMTVNIPRITTPTATGVQASEGAALTTQDAASTLLTANINTVGGYVTVSRQALDRGTILEEVLTADMSADYNARLDAQVLNGSGSAGQHLGILGVAGINSVVFTQASPTVPLLWPKMVSALSQVWTGRFAGPTAFLMSPKVWAWIVSVVDTAGRPLVEPEGVAVNPTAVQTSATYGGQAGVLFGVPVFMDGNCPDTLGAGSESRIIVANFSDIYLFEDANGAPTQMRFEAPAAQNLQILLVAYGYSAFAAGRQPKAISVVSGTGMIVPAL
jgi:HK97 family phage major capsid protein